MNTDLTLLRAFVEVARTASFGRAAEQLHLDPSTVSRQIAQLERRLGLRLFERTTRQVWLSDAGHALLGRAEEVITAADAFARSATAIDRQARGEVVVGFQVHAINSEVLGWITHAEREACTVTVRLQEGTFSDPSTGLHDRSADLALVFCPFETSGLELAPLFELPWLLFLPSEHPLAGEASIPLARVLDEPWVGAASDDPVFTDYWLAADLRGDPPWNQVDAYATPEAGLAFIATGRAIGAGASARWPLHLDGVVAVPVADDRRTTVALAWPEEGLTEGAQRFRDALLARARERAGTVGSVPA